MANEAYVGARREIAFTKETTRGTAAAYGAGDWQPHEDFDFMRVVEKTQDQPGLGRIEQTFRMPRIKAHSEGSVNLRLTKDFAGAIAVMEFGKDADSVTGTDPYTHTWDDIANNNRHQTYTVHEKDPVSGWYQYPGVLPNEISYTFNRDEIIKVVLGLMGRDREPGTAGTTSYTALEYPFYLPQQITYRLADTKSGLSSADDEFAQEITLTTAKNVAPYFTLGKLGVDDQINQRIAVTGTITRIYSGNDVTFRDLAETDTEKALQIKADDGTYSWTREISRCEFTNYQKNTGLDDYMTESVDFEAMLDLTDGFMSQEIVDNVASH